MAGMADAYCGPKIIHEDANRIVAFEDRDFFVVKSSFSTRNNTRS